MFTPRRLSVLTAVIALLSAIVLIASSADARVGRGGGIGSRGAHTYSPPPMTRTAPNQAAPINRSATQPQRPSAGAAATAPAQGGLLGRPGFAGGLMAGFLGAGLLGLLFGGGLFGGLGAGFASFLGLLLQIVLIVVIVRLLLSWWQRRNAEAYAPAGGPSLRDLARERAPDASFGGGAGAMSHGVQQGMQPGEQPLEIGEADYNAFERLLADIQAAYSAQDTNRLRALVTPEMLGYLADDLADNASRGLVNEIGDVRLLQGDLAEAWREGTAEYATVAMRFSLTDATIERATGRVVEGSRETPQEVTEIWTFRRAPGGNWILSAIQQA